MESRTRSHHTILSVLIAYYISVSAINLFIQYAGKHAEKSETQYQKQAQSFIGVQTHLNIDQPSEYSDFEASEASSPFSLSPFDFSSPQNSPPFYVFSPFSPQMPPLTLNPPSSSPERPPAPLLNSPRPPNPTPPRPPTPPVPPYFGPNPPKSGPSPPTHSPPVTYPPPSPGVSVGPPPGHKKPEFTVWCVAKPTVPDSIMQPALDYACGSGADCKSIQPNGPCYLPNTLLAHASFAFNSYFQKSKLAGGTCDFGGTAMLVTDDPSKAQ
ncbi:X8 domain containing protein [Parasponia andersonii]|uniref:X8 domain containing protein n=1 Tax=Parasponia andersonii TaxID=3476 RepID=A0A2P5AQB6_PARAD|nr:X8 domain containing protein [Parasponia andersonii]